MFFRIIKFLILTLALTIKLWSDVNLEDHVQDFVLKTKQIQIPGYPHAFNPSIIKWRGKILMSFRVIPQDGKITDFYSSADSKIGLIWLDDDFNPASTPQILSFGQGTIRSEDARLIAICDKLYLVYSDNREQPAIISGFRMYISELQQEGNHFEVAHTDVILHFEGENPNRREKNWTPFNYQDHLLLSYSLSPHKILYPIPFSTHATTLCSTENPFPWAYGELRGGTPALLDDDGEYFSFFHSSINLSTLHSQNVPMPHYFLGAYTFSSDPPFQITKISPEPIMCEGFYSGCDYVPYWKPVRVIFPCGFLFDGPYIYLSYGRQDHEIWILKLDKYGLKNSLLPIN